MGQKTFTAYQGDDVTIVLSDITFSQGGPMDCATYRVIGLSLIKIGIDSDILNQHWNSTESK